MASSNVRASTISAATLNATLNRAVAEVIKNHPAKVEPNNLILNAQILGRMLREEEKAEEAFGIATSIAAGVKIEGVTVEPAMSMINGRILVGYLERHGMITQLGEEQAGR
jgi:hypothetical protein